jgi:hypothetical protein
MEGRYFPLSEKYFSIENWLPEWLKAKAQSGCAFRPDNEMEHPPVSEKKLSRQTIWHPLQSTRSLAQIYL